MFLFLAEAEDFNVDAGLVITILFIIFLALGIWYFWTHRRR